MAFIDSTWNWRQLSPMTPPVARTAHDMVWDGSRVVLFGGIHTTPSTGVDDTTWELVGDEWNELFPSTVPGGRGDHRMIWDGSKVLMMGGADFSGLLDETWKYEAANWTQLTIATSIPRPINHVMVWDDVNSRVLALVANNPPYAAGANVTWEYTDGSGDWTALTLGTEFPDVGSALLWSAAGAWCDDRMVVGNGGDSGGGKRVNGFYDLILADWATRVADNQAQSYSPPSQYPRREQGAGVWTGDQFFFYGGADGPDAVGITFTLGDQYVYDPATFTVSPITTADTPGVTYGHRMVWDGTRVILFGPRPHTAGSLTNETWVLEPPVVPIPPPTASIKTLFGLGS